MQAISLRDLRVAMMILTLRIVLTIPLLRSMEATTISSRRRMPSSHGLVHLWMQNMATLFFRRQDRLMYLQPRMRSLHGLQDRLSIITDLFFHIHLHLSLTYKFLQSLNSNGPCA